MKHEIQPRTAFDWAIYANATLAGLAVLIPIPILDWMVEWFFRRRILSAISKRRGRQLDPEVLRVLKMKNDRGCTGCLVGCLMLPVILTIELIKGIFKKILYFLTIKDATDQLSYYWHQAFLFDYMLLAGHLDEVESAQLAQQAMTRVLSNVTTSPVLKLAQQTTSSLGNVVNVLRYVRQSKEEKQAAQSALQMKGRWHDVEGYFNILAEQYEQVYGMLQEERLLSEQAGSG